MKPLAKLLHQTCTTYLPTTSPAHFYGMPDGSVFVIFSRFIKVPFEPSVLEFLFAIHEEFTFDYENEKIMSCVQSRNLLPVYAETIDKPNPKIKIIQTKRDLYSFGEAVIYLNNMAELRQPISA